jgi:peroxidase
VLLDPTLENPQPEKLGIPNVGSLRGFQVIDAAKHALEEACPGIVSCADIVAFAARDASYILSVSEYRTDFHMPAGRLDGRYSNATETLDFLPSPFGNLSELVTKFAAKGLDEEDLVVLSGAHSIGRAHCSSFADRGSRSDMDPSFKRWLGRRCQADPGDTDSPTVRQDTVTAAVLDSQYYTNVLRHRVLLTSDAALLTSRQTARMVREFANGEGKWESKFETAMVKMAGIDVKDGTDGEIRKNCRFVNQQRER